MCLSNKFLVFISLLILASTQLVAAPPANPPPIEVDAFVVNGTDAPVPVTVQESPREIVWANARLLDVSDNRSFFWQLMNGDFIEFVPEGHILAVTDILVSGDFLGDAGPFLVAILKTDEGGGSSRQFDIAGTNLPFSQSFTTPFILQAGFGLGHRLEDNKLNVMVSGYLTPVAE